MKIRNIFASLCGALILSASVIACDESTTIGSSLVGDSVAISIDSTFTVSGHTVATGAVRSCTVDQLIGSIEIPGYGRLSSSVVTQFISSTSLDTAEFTAANVDSMVLYMRYRRGAFIGDSVAPMGLKIHALNRRLPSPIFSDFNPEGYFDASAAPLASKVYTASTLDSDSLRKMASRDISVRMPLDLARRLFSTFEEHPEYYATPEAFIDNVFPGIYIENAYGSGRMTLVSQTLMKMYLHKYQYNEETKKNDTITARHDYFLVTPEVLSDNIISLSMDPSITRMVDEGENILLAPAGLEMEIEFPVREVVDRYRADKADLSVVNSLTFSIPASEIENDFKVEVPPYLLMVLKSKRDEFFANNSLPDKRTSFYAAYNSTTGTYDFSSMRSYLLDMLEKEEIKEEDYTFSLVPVQVEFEELVNSGYYSTTVQKTESAVTPYVMAPAMARVDLSKAKVKFTYSSQKNF